MESRFDKDFIVRYLSGDCSDEEQHQFKKWLNDPQSSGGWVRSIWNESAKEKNELLGAREKILQNMLEEISNGPSKKKQSIKTVDHFKYQSIWKKYPFLRYASILALIMVPLFLLKTMSAEELEPLQVQYMNKETHNGQHLTFRLEDGTIITLNANSSLSFPEHFTDSSRHVTLKGEAFFDVAKDAHRPFSVSTGSFTTTALGTSFNIDYSQGDHFTEVSLLSGSVEVDMQLESGNDQIILSPGEQVVCTDNKSYKKKNFDPMAVAGWKDGVIYFEEAGIDEIVNTLEEWYDVDIEVRRSNDFDTSTPWAYSGDFKNQSLENVLIGISYVKDFTFEIEGKKINLMLN